MDGMGMWDPLVENFRSRAQSRSPSSLLCDSLGFAFGLDFLYDSSLDQTCVSSNLHSADWALVSKTRQQMF